MQEIEIVDNALLTDLTGLENIVSTSFIGLSGNGITSLNGLQNLESVQNSFIINWSWRLNLSSRIKCKPK